MQKKPYSQFAMQDRLRDRSHSLATDECCRLSSRPDGPDDRGSASSAPCWHSLHVAVPRPPPTLLAPSPVPQSCASRQCFAVAACALRLSSPLNCPPSPPAQLASGDDLGRLTECTDVVTGRLR